MANLAENQMNLTVLQQQDPYIETIIDSSSQVALYNFGQSKEWEKTDIEGILFIYQRSAEPRHSFTILNNRGLRNLVEPLNTNMEFHIQDPFLLYRNGKGNILGIWFYIKDECTRIGKTIQSIADSLPTKTGDNKQQLLHKQPSNATQQQQSQTISGTEATIMSGNVDIMQMLSKAQHEYNQTTAKATIGEASGGAAEPKPMMTEGGATSGEGVVKPEPVRADGGGGGPKTAEGGGISIEALFKRATQEHANNVNVPDASKISSSSHALGNKHHSSHQAMPTHRHASMPPQMQHKPNQPSTTRPPGPQVPTVPMQGTAPTDVPPFLKRLMSHPGTATGAGGPIAPPPMPVNATSIPPMPTPVSQALHSSSGPSTVSPASSASSRQPSYSDSLSSPMSGAGVVITGSSSRNLEAIPQSPDSVLKRTLNILPTSAPSSSAAAVQPSSNKGSGMVDEVQKLSEHTTTLGEHRKNGNTSLNALENGLQKLNISSSKLNTGTVLLTPQAFEQSSSPLFNNTLQYNSTLAATQKPADEAYYSEPRGPPILTSTSLGSINTPASSSAPNHSLSMIIHANNTSNQSDAPLQNNQSAAMVGRSVSDTGAAASGQRKAKHTNKQIAALTEAQMKQAMIYMIENDDDFMRRLHEAYIKSLHQSFTS